MSRARGSARFRAVALLVLAAGCLAVFAPCLEAGICEESFVRCIYDPDLNQFFNFLASVPIYCSLGYVFCRTYVEPILD
jgi:hypothetical protein